MIKTCDLSGPTLDEWVARALGLRVEKRFRAEVRGEITVLVDGNATRGIPHYSSDWREAGPLIDKYDVNIGSEYDGTSWAYINGPANVPGSDIGEMGPTRLIAAMRVLVRSVFGDTVPEEPTK